MIKSPQTVVVTLNPDGTVDVAVVGVKGHGCTQLTAALLADLGDVQDVRHTEEFHQRAVQHDENRQRMG